MTVDLHPQFLPLSGADPGHQHRPQRKLSGFSPYALSEADCHPHCRLPLLSSGIIYMDGQHIHIRDAHALMALSAPDHLIDGSDK
jgi:hypothetical protein